MNILSKNQLYQAHTNTIKSGQLTEFQLIENAGKVVFDWMHRRMQGAQVKIHIFNGIGNNGGVGLVLGRLLIEHGYNVNNFVINFSKKRTKGFLTNYDKIKATKIWPTLINSIKDFPEIHKDDIIVDAIFGIGLNRDLSIIVKDIIDYLNNSKAFKLSIDIPSGLFPDTYPTDFNHIIKSDYTISFNSPKLVFFLKETAIYTKQWEVLDIGMQTEIKEEDYLGEFIGKNEAKFFYKPRDPFVDKQDLGHTLFIGGQKGKFGAITLATKASLLIGTGNSTVFIPEKGSDICQISSLETNVETDENENFITNITVDESKYNAIAIGTDFGTDKNAIKAFSSFISKVKKPIVIDDDAIGILASNINLLNKLPENSILTANSNEVELLVGKYTDEMHLIELMKQFSNQYNCILMCKGAFTKVVHKNQLYVNGTINPALATTSSGDVLTGIITGLLAQNYEPILASIFGVYIHGTTANLAATQMNVESFIASTILDFIPDVFIDLFKKPEMIEEQQAQ